MKSQDFDLIVERRIKLAQEVLLKKRAEYAPDGKDRLHNFKRAASMLNTTPEKALVGMLTKHLVSLLDIVDDIPKTPSIALLEEKIGDSVNYLILLEAMIKERLGGYPLE